MSEVKRYDAVHLRYEDSNIRYGEGCEVEVVAAYDYARLEQECERLRVKLMTIASAEPARHNIEWAKAMAAECNNEVYAQWREAFGERDAALKQVEGLRVLLTRCRAYLDPHRDADLWSDVCAALGPKP